MVTPAAGLKSKEIWTESLPAGEDATGNAFLFHITDANYKAVIATAQGSVVAGVSMIQPATDTADGTKFTHKLMKIGRTPIKASAAIAKDAKITNDADGKAITATETDLIHGVCRQAADNADEIVWCDVMCNGGTLLITDNT